MIPTMSKTASKAQTFRKGAREIRVIGEPRHIAGGYVVAVCWASDDTSQKLRDGTIHPAHQAGFTWEEPILNIDGYHPFSPTHASQE